MNLLRDRDIARPLSASLFGFQRRKLCLWTISWMMSKSHVNRRNKRLISLFVVFRQVQNLRDELYQAKLRLEKETFSLKDTNKVTFLEQFSRWSKEPRMIFILLHFALWLVKKNAPLSHSQPIRCKIKTTATWSLAFSRASGRLLVLNLNSYWLVMMISFALIGHSGFFGLGFTPLSRNAHDCNLIFNLLEGLRVNFM